MIIEGLLNLTFLKQHWNSEHSGKSEQSPPNYQNHVNA